MKKTDRTIHTDFLYFLEFKDAELIDLYRGLRKFVLKMYPEANELLYHTHALTSCYSISTKLSDAFCMLPIYTNHVNLGFNKGALLSDPEKLLQGTGKLIRHVPVTQKADYNNPKVKALIQSAIDLAIADMNKPTDSVGKTISKIKR